MAKAHYVALTVQSGQVSGTLSGVFPWLLSHTFAPWKSAANGGRVQNTDSGKPADWAVYADSALTTLLPYQIEKWDPTTGEIIAWIGFTSIVDGAVVYIGYNDAGQTTSQDNPTGVFDSNFKIVQHHGDGSTLSLADTTGNYSSANTGATAAAGKIHGAADFNGSTQHYQVTDGYAAVSGDQTWRISIWVKVDSFTNAPVIWSAGRVSPELFNDYIGIEVDATHVYWWTRVAVGAELRTYNISLGSGWNKLSAEHTGSGDNGVLYLNGAAQTPASGTISTTQTQASRPIFVGRYNNVDGTFNLDGQIDEFRVSAINRGADYDAAEHKTEHAPTTFSALGSEITVGGGSPSVVRSNKPILQAVNRAATW